MYYTPLSRGMFIGSRTWPPLHLDAVVAMRSESRAAPRAIATVIFSFCFFVMPVFVCRTAENKQILVCVYFQQPTCHCTADQLFWAKNKQILVFAWTAWKPRMACLGHTKPSASSAGLFEFCVVLWLDWWVWLRDVCAFTRCSLFLILLRDTKTAITQRKH